EPSRVIALNTSTIKRTQRRGIKILLDLSIPACVYEDQAGYCKSATLAEIRKHDYVLTPGRYVGAADIEDDGIPFETKMREMSQRLYAQMTESARLDTLIRKNLEVLGYGE
ncbi:MAG: SAM-dependent DNA methyltransferase, partial [Calditrichaeota bacterium]|nr:SAM-dependent DNA methyltransferase [Calditrichota bacterium]